MMAIIETLKADLSIIWNDPALKSWPEAFLCYPGLWALWSHRLCHFLYTRLGLVLLARFLATLSRIITGCDIHPGARIGKGVMIDHGLGVVIGETAIVGDYCTIYQGVTLGGTGKERGKRHPTLGNNVLVGSGAKVLGNIVIGDGCSIGAGSVVVKSAPPNSTIVGVPGRVVMKDNKRVNHQTYPDIDAGAIKALYDKTKRIEEDLEQLSKDLMSKLEKLSSSSPTEEAKSDASNKREELQAEGKLKEELMEVEAGMEEIKRRQQAEKEERLRQRMNEDMSINDFLYGAYI